MKVSFSTVCSGSAKRYLSRQEYSYLNEQQKDYVLKNLGDIRVQDPMMYGRPCIEIHNDGPGHNDKLMKMITKKETP